MKYLLIIVLAFIIAQLYTDLTAQVIADSIKTAEINIKGITCTGDMPVIKKKLINSEGIDEVVFSEVKSGSVLFTIKYHTSFITEKKICEIIESAPSCDNPGIYPYKAKIPVKNLKLNKSAK